MFLKNLDLLMEERNINKHTLSKESGIPYTTIVGWYKKGWSNISLITLKKLSEYFSISIDTLVQNKTGNQEELTFKEKEFLKKYRRIDERGIETLTLLLDAEYKRSNAEKAAQAYGDTPIKPALMVAESSDE